MLEFILVYHILLAFDSIAKDSVFYCSDLGTHVISDEDQDYNDFDKAIKLAAKQTSSSIFDTTNDITTTAKATTNNNSTLKQRPVSLVALGAFGGRFDQEMSSIHALHKWKNTFDRIVLLDKHNSVFLLDGQEDTMLSTTHMMDCVEGIEGPTCGLIPLAGAAERVWTKGLHWNLSGDQLKMGNLISSSNYVERINSETLSHCKSESACESEIEDMNKYDSSSSSSGSGSYPSVAKQARMENSSQTTSCTPCCWK